MIRKDNYEQKTLRLWNKIYSYNNSNNSIKLVIIRK
jgi:hypothetical protein